VCAGWARCLSRPAMLCNALQAGPGSPESERAAGARRLPAQSAPPSRPSPPLNMALVRSATEASLLAARLAPAGE